MINKPGGPPKKAVTTRGPVVTNRQVRNQTPQEFVRGVVLELKRVTWPTQEEWVSATVLTVVLVVGIGLFTYICDWLFGQVFGFIHPV